MTKVHTLRDVIKLGDIVLASGCMEPGSLTMRVTCIEVTEPWKALHAGVSFVPKLLPSLHAAMQSCPANNGSSPANTIPALHDSAAVHMQQRDMNTQPLCKYWVNTGRCLWGDTCQYQHVNPSQLPELRQGWVTARRRHKQELSREAGNPHGLDAARKGQRAAIFCDWLIATFGSEVMKQGSGVLDIAGGRGDVSFELQTVRGIRCTLIDPRPQKVSKPQRRWLKNFAASPHHPTDAAQQAERSSVTGTSEALPSSREGQSQTQRATNGLQAPRPAAPDFPGERSSANQLASEPSSRAARFDSAQAQASAAEAEVLLPAQASAFHDSAQAQESAAEASILLPAQASAAEMEFRGEEGQGGTACCQQPTPQGDACQLHQSDLGSSAQHTRPDLRGTLSHQIQAEFKPELWTEGELSQQLQACSLVIGLHPDQATDGIVDFAMQCGKPFAVVPCCVFPRQFQDRQLRNSCGKVQQVLTHSDLIQYLQQKSSSSTEHLGFDGMNQVVFGNIPTST